MYAILETGGKQYRVEQGDTIYVEKLPYEELEIVELDKIVAVGKDDGIVVGKPYVDGATVTAKIAKNGRKNLRRESSAIDSLTPRSRFWKSKRNQI